MRNVPSITRLDMFPLPVDHTMQIAVVGEIRHNAQRAASHERPLITDHVRVLQHGQDLNLALAIGSFTRVHARHCIPLHDEFTHIFRVAHEEHGSVRSLAEFPDDLVLPHDVVRDVCRRLRCLCTASDSDSTELVPMVDVGDVSTPMIVNSYADNVRPNSRLRSCANASTTGVVVVREETTLYSKETIMRTSMATRSKAGVARHPALNGVRRQNIHCMGARIPCTPSQRCSSGGTYAGPAKACCVTSHSPPCRASCRHSLRHQPPGL